MEGVALRNFRSAEDLRRRRAARASGEKLPDFAKKADDLEALKKAVDDAAAVGGGLWLSYLLALFYLMVAAGSVTHADLFFEKPINLLFFNVQLPIVAFFALAPLLFLALHAYALAHLVMLSDKAKRFHAALYAQIGEAPGMSEEEKQTRKRVRDGLRGQLPSNVFVQFLAGPPEMRAGLFGRALRAIGWGTLAFGPVLLFVLFQVQFLPYHSEAITWVHRIALFADLALVWWLFRRILDGREPEEGRAPRRIWVGRAWVLVGGAASVVVVLFSVVLATYRGERVGAALASLDPTGEVAGLHRTLFQSEVAPQMGRRWLLLADALVLRRVDALDQLKIDNPERVKEKDFIFIAPNRDFAGAEFQNGSLGRVDFRKANLRGAMLEYAQLQGASLAGAQLQGASLDGARLQGVSLDRAQLQGASLDGARLQGVSLDRAQLQGASLDGARLQGASLYGAQLQGASLDGARLQGASLDSAQLQGASLRLAQLQGASLDGAQLQGASLDYALIKATWLPGAHLWRSTGNDAKVVDLDFQPSQAMWGPFLYDIFEEELPWNPDAFDDLRNSIEALPAGERREAALKRIEVLNCADTTRVSCDPAQAQNPPPDFAAWRDRLLIAAKTDPGAFRRALAMVLRQLTCPGDENTLYVLRGEGFQSNLKAAGDEALPLIADLSDKSRNVCPVAAQLTDGDRAKLSQIKADVEAAPVAPPAK